MKQLRMISRLLIGIVFVFSGFVKAIDPMGSAYKFGDYFSAFGLHFLSPVSLLLAVILSSAELTMGVVMLISYRMRIFTWVILFFMSFFTILTFILALYNPVTDCGCFGDALILTNWETFWKNIIIEGFVLYVFFHRRNFKIITQPLTEWLVIAIVFISISGLSVYSLNHLPPLDFRPYSTGSNIPQKMIIPPDAPGDIYETTLIYKNKQTGKEEEFTMDNFPKDTILFSFVDARSKLVSKGYEPPVHDFAISSLAGVDITDRILNDQAYSFLLISYNVSGANKSGMEEADLFAKLARVNDEMEFYCITASSSGEIENIRNELNISFEFYNADEITLKTIIRSNPGLLLLKNGSVIGKWHFNDYPDPTLSKQSLSEIMGDYPFIPGAEIRKITQPPQGAGPGIYETILYYKNVNTDSILTYTIENFPKSPEWVFVNSESKLINPGLINPLNDFKALTPEGIDISDQILYSGHNVFIVLVDNPEKIDPELLARVNNLSVATPASDAEMIQFYMLTGIDNDDLITFTGDFVSPMSIASLEGDFIKRIAKDGIALIWIKNGKIMKIRKNNDIPEPYYLSEFMSSYEEPVDADDLLLPVILDSYRKVWEKRFVWLFILTLISFGLFLRVWVEKKSD